MTKKTAIIIILISILIITGALFYYYFYYSTTPTIDSDTTQNGNTENIFGGTSGDKQFGTNGTNQGNTPAPTIHLETLRQIYTKPTSGSVFFSRDSKAIMRFTDRATGNTYEYIPETGISAIRITNTTKTKIHEAIWAPDGNHVLLRTLSDDNNTINTFNASVRISTTTSNVINGELAGDYLPINIGAIAINPKGDKIFGLSKNSDGGSIGTLYSFTDKNQKKIFESPIGLWDISWPNDNTVLFTTNASHSDQGFSYFLNPLTASFEKITGNAYGLSSLANNNSSLTVFSKIINNTEKINIYDAKTKKINDLDISTMADKCAWGRTENKNLYCGVPSSWPSGLYPDAWYQGSVKFTDNIWFINPNKTTEQLVETKADMMDIQISSDDKYLSFRNKNDYSLWVLDITKALESAQEFSL